MISTTVSTDKLDLHAIVAQPNAISVHWRDCSHASNPSASSAYISSHLIPPCSQLPPLGSSLFFSLSQWDLCPVCERPGVFAYLTWPKENGPQPVATYYDCQVVTYRRLKGVNGLEADEKSRGPARTIRTSQAVSNARERRAGEPSERKGLLESRVVVGALHVGLLSRPRCMHFCRTPLLVGLIVHRDCGLNVNEAGNSY